ncbi:MAG: septum formation initiator family protein [Clostridiaceae bacterium]|nr:septum formation initiator family protein [Clostridiaceae bacterium]
MKKKINYRKIVFGILLVYLSYFLFRQYQTINRISAETKKQKLIYEKLKEDHDNLQDNVELSKTSRYQEIIARQILHLIKDGEIPVIDSAKK